MLSPRLTNCPECSDIPSLLKKIDCKLAELGNNLYNNISYMLNKSVPSSDILQLIGYRRILMYKYYNPNYVHTYSVQMIASRVIRLTSGCVSKCNEPERCLEEPCDITIVQNPTTTTTTSTTPSTSTTTTSTTIIPTTTTSTSSSTSTTTSTSSTSTTAPPTTTSTTIQPTTTTTTTLPIIITECSTFIVYANNVGYYDFETNSFTNLFSEGSGSWNDVANTNDKLWIANSGLIKEYDITFNPWTASFNRNIIINAGPGLTAVDNDFLIGSMSNKIILIDISGTTPTYTEIATLPSFGSLYGSSISGDIMLTANNKLICTVQTYTEGSPDYYHTRLLQYDFITMNLEVVVDLYPIVNGPFGLTENNGNIYIFNASDSNKLFSISSIYPYETNEVNVLSEQVLGASVEKSCVTSSFITTTTTSSSSSTTTTTTTIQTWIHYFSNSAADVISSCAKVVTANTFYSTDEILTTGSILYTDINLNTPFVGNSQWYKKLSPSIDTVYQLNNVGEIININSCV